MQLAKEYDDKTLERQIYLDDLSRIVMNSNVSSLEGNCFYYNTTLALYPELYNKQLNLFYCGQQALSHICEIGFNAGHSAMVMLLGRQHNTPLNFTIFDLDYHSYTTSCVEYIKSKFHNVNFQYIKGDSTITMPEWIHKNEELIGKYNLIHVDGGHSEDCILNDMKHADILLKVNGSMIIDDTNADYINRNVELYISNGNYIELDVLKTFGYPHRIIKKIK